MTFTLSGDVKGTGGIPVSGTYVYVFQAQTGAYVDAAVMTLEAYTITLDAGTYKAFIQTNTPSYPDQYFGGASLATATSIDLSGDTVQDLTLDAQPTAVWAPPYATAAALRSFMRVPAVDGNDADDVLQDTAVYEPAIEAASRVIDRSAGRQFGSTDAEERFYTPWYSDHAAAWFIDIDDLMDDTGLTVTIAEVDVTADCILLPRNAGANLRPWTMMQVTSGGEATVEAVWGWSAIPAAIVSATLLQASRFVKRRDAPFGVAGSPDMGNELRLQSKLDPDVEVLIRSLRRYW